MTDSTALFSRAQSFIPGGVNSPVRAFKALVVPPYSFKKRKVPIFMTLMENNMLTMLVLGGQ